MQRYIGAAVFFLLGAFFGATIFFTSWGISYLTAGQIKVPEWCEPLIWLGLMGLVVLLGNVVKPTRATYRSGVSAGD